MFTVTDTVTLVSAWCSLHLFLLLVRLPFSEERIGRLKAYGQGVACVMGVVVLAYLCHLASGVEWIRNPFMIQAPRFAQICAATAVTAATVLAFAAMFILLLGHAATMWFSWLAGDLDIWSRNN